MARKKPPRADRELPIIAHNALWGTNAVAEILQVNPSTLVRWTKTLDLKYQRTPGGHRRFNMSDVASFLQQRDIPVPFGLTQR